MKNVKLFTILCGLTLATLASCGGEKKAEVVTEKQEIVVVTEAKREVVPNFVSYNGTIEPNKRNNIASASPSRIDNIFIEIGDNVKKGDIIAEMDKSQLYQQELQVENLATDLTRLEELYKTGGVSEQQLEQLRTQHKVAKKALAYLADNATLDTPISGIVTGRYYDNGDMFSMTPNASGTSCIAQVMQIDSVKIRVNISEDYFTNIKLGMNVNINADSYPNAIFKGEISLIFPLIDAATHSFTVEITIPNKDLRLRPGMYTNTNIDFGKRNIVILKDMAIQKQIGSNEKYVFIAKDGVAKRRSIKTGKIYGDKVEIISGIEPGEFVISKGAGRLVDGDKIKIVED